MTAIYALVAAFSNALFVATQHVASTSGRAERASGMRLAVRLFRSPLWLFGWVAGLSGFLFQAAALNVGQLSIVQALLVTELVFGLVLRRIWIHQQIVTAAWVAAAVTCAGLALFAALHQPRGGVESPAGHTWAGALGAFGGAAALMVLAARRGSPARRAGLYATAAAIVWALEATFIKTATNILTGSGVGPLFTQWPVYALAAGGVLGTVLVQAALHVGPLSVSQPLLVIVDPIVSIVLSVWLFQERYTQGPAVVAASIVAFAVMCAGVVALTRASPADMRRPATLDAQEAAAG